MGTIPWSMAILLVAASSKNSDCTAAAAITPQQGVQSWDHLLHLCWSISWFDLK